MSQQQPSNFFRAGGPSRIVGTVHTPGGLEIAGSAQADTIDLVEIRLDCLPPNLTANDLATIPRPLILTPRNADEGGARNWTDSERSASCSPLLPAAAALDLELASLEPLQELWEQARVRSIATIASFHDFSGTPPLRDLLEKRDLALERGATLFKAAVTPHHPSDLATLLEFLEESRSVPVALMGMGPLGKISRLLFSSCGSALLYGWLDKPQVPGQFPATQLRDLLASIAG